MKKRREQLNVEYVRTTARRAVVEHIQARVWVRRQQVDNEVFTNLQHADGDEELLAALGTVGMMSKVWVAWCNW